MITVDWFYCYHCKHDRPATLEPAINEVMLSGTHQVTVEVVARCIVCGHVLATGSQPITVGEEPL